MSVRIPWDDHEISLMFEAYLKMAKGMPIKKAAQELSEQLRQKAINQGVQIDDVFRNINGMLFYLKRTEYLFTNGRSGMPGPQKNVVRMFELYKSNPVEYRRVLREAQAIAGIPIHSPDLGNSNDSGENRNEENAMNDWSKELKERFAKWLSDRVSSAQLSELYQASLMLDEFCVSRNILKSPAFQTIDVKVLNRALTALEGNRVFKMKYQSRLALAAFRHYITFVKENQESLAALKIGLTANNDEQSHRLEETNATQPTSRSVPNSESAKAVPEDTSQITHSTEEILAVSVAAIDNAKTVDFDAMTDYADTIPYGFSYFGKLYNASSWQEVYLLFVEKLYKDYPHQAAKLEGKTLSGTSHVLFGNGTNAEKMKNAKRIPGTTIYAEANFSPNGLIKLIKLLMRFFAIDKENVVIKYRTVEKHPAPEATTVEQHPVEEKEARDHYCDWLKDQYGIYWMAHYGALRPLAKLVETDSSNGKSFFEMTDISELKDLKAKVTNPANSVSIGKDCVVELDIYIKYLKETGVADEDSDSSGDSSNSRWKEILEKDFPNGYILGDFLCQFQAAGMWQEHYNEPCPLEGEAIDKAISACGTVKDGQVFFRKQDEGKLLLEIANLVAGILRTYTSVYTVQVYQRYREALASLNVFTEKVMIQQVMKYAARRFCCYGESIFCKSASTANTRTDCETVLRNQGGMMATDDIAEKLWFIPKDKVSHSLSMSDTILNIGVGQWMLVENFPISSEDAAKVADMLRERFLSQEYVLARSIPDLLQKNLPSIAENVSSLSFTGLFNILYYYLKNEFSFSQSIVAPRGAHFDFNVLFTAFGSEHESFSMDDLDAYAKELNVPIYWESVYSGGAVRISQDSFVNRNQIEFDIDAIDRVLESICSGDYMSFQAIPSGMLMLLPSCGYQWNRFLLQSYVYGFSRRFRLVYNSMAKNGCYGAIVRRSCGHIADYDTLVEQILTDDSSWISQDDALNLLVKQGYQAQRKLKGIENIIQRSKLNKMQ